MRKLYVSISVSTDTTTVEDENYEYPLSKLTTNEVESLIAQIKQAANYLPVEECKIVLVNPGAKFSAEELAQKVKGNEGSTLLRVGSILGNPQPDRLRPVNPDARFTPKEIHQHAVEDEQRGDNNSAFCRADAANEEAKKV